MIKSLATAASRFLARRPRLLFGIQERTLRAAYKLFDLDMAAWVIRRPEWLRAKSAREVRRLIDDASPVAPGDPGLAERIVKAYGQYAESTGDNLVSVDSMWGMLRKSHYATLMASVHAGDIDAVLEFQQNLFRTDAVNGFSYGTTFNRWPHRWHYLSVHIELSVVQLAEAVGIMRAECHEQGRIAFWPDVLAEDELITRLEAYFGVRIEQPRYGNPRGIMFGGRFLARETCSHIYTAWRIRSAIERMKIEGPLDLVEIGGGFGGTCYWLRQLLGERVGRYVIVDLPDVGVVQAGFLGACHPDRLILPGEQREQIDGTIRLVAHDALDSIDFRPDVVINQDSMPEMPESEVRRYLAWINDRAEHLFVSFNQETYSPFEGVHQVWVPQMAARQPRLKRIARETSWDRRGYVEEIYAIDSGKARHGEREGTTEQ